MIVFLLALIEIPLMIAVFIVIRVMRVALTARARSGRRRPAAKQTRPSAPLPAEEKAKPARKELSGSQRTKIVDAILDDALLLNDRVWDTLITEGAAEYDAVDACKLPDAKEFELQYGSDSWLASWKTALADRFDCSSRYEGKGKFLVYGKEV